MQHAPCVGITRKSALKELRGSMSVSFLSNCQAKHYTSCKFSHTIFNTDRVIKLGRGSEDFHVKLDYGYGFERYGSYEGWSSGWDVIVEREKPTGRVAVWKKLTIFQNLSYWRRVRWDSSTKSRAFVNPIMKARDCLRPDCRYDHDLMDGARIEKLVRWSAWGTDTFDFMTLECRKSGGRVQWKITMKPDAFKQLRVTDPIARTIPARPFSLEDANLLDLVKRVEGVVGLVVSDFSDKGSSNLKLMRFVYQ
ncbi:hypothetical protein BU15DRAFT_74184 [Melanogaster broomeanus]|nr:hypothetical protein BU15DRAFT_74184 [Melanogaster broomeanus]